MRDHVHPSLTLPYQNPMCRAHKIEAMDVRTNGGKTEISSAVKIVMPPWNIFSEYYTRFHLEFNFNVGESGDANGNNFNQISGKKPLKSRKKDRENNSTSNLIETLLYLCTSLRVFNSCPMYVFLFPSLTPHSMYDM